MIEIEKCDWKECEDRGVVKIQGKWYCITHTLLMGEYLKHVRN